MYEFFLWWRQIRGLRHRLVVEFALQTPPNTENTLNWYYILIPYTFTFPFSSRKKRRRRKTFKMFNVQVIVSDSILGITYRISILELTVFSLSIRNELLLCVLPVAGGRMVDVIISMIFSCHLKRINRINCSRYVVFEYETIEPIKYILWNKNNSLNHHSSLSDSGQQKNKILWIERKIKG